MEDGPLIFVGAIYPGRQVLEKIPMNLDRKKEYLSSFDFPLSSQCRTWSWEKDRFVECISSSEVVQVGQVGMAPQTEDVEPFGPV